MTFDIAKTSGLVSAAALAAGAQGAQAQAFDGLYAGLSFSYMAGDSALHFGDSYDYQLNEDAALGLFVGYNMTLASGMVAGVELAFVPNMDTSENGGSSASDTSYPNEHDSLMIDAKFKLGRVLGSTASSSMPIMLYGFGGISALDSSSAADSDYGTAFGVNYGFGAEMALSNGFLIGLEVIGRTMDGYGYDGSSSTRNNYGASLRAGFRF